MTAKPFIGLCIATVIAVVLAIFAIGSRPAFQSSDVDDQPVFADLINDLNRLSTVVIQHNGGTYTIDLSDGGWKLRERGNYPVDAAKVNELVIDIARLAKVEAKTKLPDRYQRLDLQAPEEDGSRAKQVTLLDKDGQTLADLIIGKRKFTLGSKEGGTYIRLPGEEQTWLARGELNPGDKARDWLQRDITDIKADALDRVIVTHPDGKQIIAGQDSPTDPNFRILNMPQGVVQATDFVADDFGRMLSMLMLDDVRAAEDLSWPLDNTISAVFRGFAGFEVTVKLAEINGEHWIKVSGTPPPAVSQQPTPESADPQTEAAETPSGPDWAKVIETINARTQGWAYQVPIYEISALKKRMDELTRKPDADADKS